MKRRMVSFLLVSVLVLILIGCTQGGKVDKSQKDTQPKKINEVIILDFPSWQATELGFSDWWKEVIAEFENTHNNVKINFYQVPFNSYLDYLMNQFGANNPPDICHLASRFLLQFSEVGWLESLDERLKETDINEKWTVLQNGMIQNNKTYGVLLLGSAFNLFYNEKMFEEAGLKVPTNPDEFIKAARKLTIDKNGDGNVDQFGFGATTTTHNNVYSDASMFVVGYGGHWSKDGKLTLNDENLIKGLKLYKTIFDEKLVPVGLTDVQKRQYFVEEKVAMIMDGPWVTALMDEIPDDIKPNLKIASLPFPTISGRLSNSIHIPSAISDERKELVWDFVKMISEERWQKRYAELTKLPAPREGVITEELMKQVPPLEIFAKDAQLAKDITPPGFEGDYVKFSKIVVDAMMEIQTTDISVEDEMKKLENQINQNIK